MVRIWYGNIIFDIIFAWIADIHKISLKEKIKIKMAAIAGAQKQKTIFGVISQIFLKFQ